MKTFLILFLPALLAFGFDVGNGKSLILTLDDSRGVLELNDRNITVLPHPIYPNKGFAIIPIDYHEQPHLINAQWNNGHDHMGIEVNVTCAAYPTEVITVDNDKVCPPPEVLQRIAAEKAEAEAIYKHITPERYWDKPFIRPIDSITTSQYGSARTYNGVLKSYHGGVDFRAKTPLPIMATNDGVVVLVKERYYAGGTIIIDHGEGIYSCYFHMSQFDVKAGDTVVQGQKIGLSGASGRITGPHLHFGFMLQGVQSDPIEFMTQIEALFTHSHMMVQNTIRAPL
ncbi:MAG TPA: M23 family metallopeptidase [Sulfuricurvum sp.]|nr:M23 family metallopeptidase [Sulfuricurvum sp.]